MPGIAQVQIQIALIHQKDIAYQTIVNLRSQLIAQSAKCEGAEGHKR